MRVLSAAAIVALSLLIGAPAAAQPAGQTILVWSYGFSPNPIHLTAGRPVILHFRQSLRKRPRFHCWTILQERDDHVRHGRE